MPLIPRRRHQRRYYSSRKVLTAAAQDAVLTAAARDAHEGGTPGTVSTTGALHQPWQAKLFGYYDIMGECWNPAQFYARGLAKIRYFPAELKPDGELVEIESGPAVDAMEQISHVAAEYGRLIGLIGEGRLCQSRPPADPDADPVPDAEVEIVWEFLSPTEVRLADEGKKIIRQIGAGSTDVWEYENISEGDGDEPGQGQMRMWRFWRKHPRNSALADSPFRACIDLYEQLWWLTMHERADLQNRIANAGLMLIPEEIDFGTDEDAEDEAVEGEDTQVDPFQTFVGTMMMTAIQQPGTAAAAVPGVIRGPAEYLHQDFFRMLHTHDPNGSVITSQREKAIIERIAMSLDLPVEEVLGLSKANHWTAYKVEDQKWQHLEPIAVLFAKDVATAYLRPYLRANHGTAVNGVDISKIVLGYDNSEFTRDPDKGKTAIQLHKDGLLAGEATLVANGFEDTDRMPDDEYQDWLAIQLRTPAIADPSLAPPEPPDDRDVQEPDADDAPAGEEPEGPGTPSAEAARDLAIAFAVKRARATAGALARSARRSCPECFTGTEAIPSHELISALGQARLAKITTPAKAVESMALTFVATLGELGWHADPERALGFFTETLYGQDDYPVMDAAEITANGSR